MRREYQERFPCQRLQRKPPVSDPGMHHGTSVTHMPWCMSGSLTRGGGKTFPAFPAHALPEILCMWQEPHWGESGSHRRIPGLPGKPFKPFLTFFFFQAKNFFSQLMWKSFFSFFSLGSLKLPQNVLFRAYICKKKKILGKDPQTPTCGREIPVAPSTHAALGRIASCHHVSHKKLREKITFLAKTLASCH